MIKHHYKNIIKTGLRFICSLGLFYASVSIVLLLIGITVIVTHSDVLLSAVLNLLIIISVHHFRKDCEHLKLYFKRYWHIYAIDYFILSLPIIYRLVSVANWTVLLGYGFILFLFVLFVPVGVSSRFTNLSTKFIPPVLLIFKSNIRAYYPVFILIFIVLYASVFLHHSLKVYCYQAVGIIAAILPTENLNGWYLKSFSNPQKLIVEFLKGIAKLYAVIIFVALLPFLADIYSLIYFLSISISGFLALSANLFFTFRFVRNKIVLALLQVISIVAIVICTQSFYVLAAQLLLTLISISSSIKSLKSEYIW